MVKVSGPHINARETTGVKTGKDNPKSQRGGNRDGINREVIVSRSVLMQLLDSSVACRCDYLIRRDFGRETPERAPFDLLDRRHPPHRTGPPTDRRVRKEGSLRE